MHKPATTDFPVHDLIRNRWSPRAFSDKPVEPAVLASLFEAARWAPSSSNEQPWAYLVATKDNPEDFAKMLSVLVEFNAGWAKSAPVLVLAMSRLKFPNGNPNRNAFYDTGAATIARPRSCSALTQALKRICHVGALGAYFSNRLSITGYINYRGSNPAKCIAR